MDLVSIRRARLQFGQMKRCAIIDTPLSRTNSERNHLMAIRQFGQSGASKCSAASFSLSMLALLFRDLAGHDRLRYIKFWV